MNNDSRGDRINVEDPRRMFDQVASNPPVGDESVSAVTPPTAPVEPEVNQGGTAATPVDESTLDDLFGEEGTGGDGLFSGDSRPDRTEVSLGKQRTWGWFGKAWSWIRFLK
jgi:hypothetical protein